MGLEVSKAAPTDPGGGRVQRVSPRSAPSTGPNHPARRGRRGRSLRISPPVSPAGRQSQRVRPGALRRPLGALDGRAPARVAPTDPWPRPRRLRRPRARPRAPGALAQRGARATRPIGLLGRACGRVGQGWAGSGKPPTGWRGGSGGELPTAPPRDGVARPSGGGRLGPTGPAAPAGLLRRAEGRGRAWPRTGAVTRASGGLCPCPSPGLSPTPADSLG